MDDEGVWTLHNKQPVPASSLLYPDVVGHGLPFGEASSNLLSTAHVDIEACRIDKHGEHKIERKLSRRLSSITD